MKTLITAAPAIRIAAKKAVAVVAFGILAIAFGASASNAQFSQAVVVLKGTVLAEGTNKPVAAKVSVRPINDTAQEVTSSRSNSESGKYLVIVKPGKKYWLHVEGDGVITRDVEIETPAAERTTQLVQDISVVTRDTSAVIEDKHNQKASLEENTSAQ